MCCGKMRRGRNEKMVRSRLMITSGHGDAMGVARLEFQKFSHYYHEGERGSVQADEML